MSATVGHRTGLELLQNSISRELSLFDTPDGSVEDLTYKAYLYLI